MIKILPSILVNGVDEFAELVNQVPTGDSLHIDFIDGKFADNETLSPIMIDDIEGFSVNKGYHDAHLMVLAENLVRWVQEAAMAKFARIIVQAETLNEWSVSNKVSWHQVFRQAQKFLWKGVWGIAIDLPTPVIEEPKILENVGVVLVMSVKAGFGGQKFDPIAIGKIKRLSKLKEENNYSYNICVDGGVTIDNIKMIFDAGANEVAIGRRLFDGDLTGNIEKYKKAVKAN